MGKNKDVIYTFKRSEKKYLVTADKKDILLDRLFKYMKMDKHGLHTICNIYYDTDSYELIRRSLEKPVYKEKIRLRSYGVPTDEDKVFLEIKKKFKGTVYKRRIDLPLEKARKYINDGVRPEKCDQILKEINYFMDYYKPKPSVFIAYDRFALYGIEDPEIRVTFDCNIRSRDYDLDLSLGDYGEMLLEDEVYIMEIKVLSSMPLWLCEILSDLEIYTTSFSKYGNVYQKNLLNIRSENSCLQTF